MSEIKQVDEGTIPVIDNEKSKTRKGYMWCVRDASGAGVFSITIWAHEVKLTLTHEMS